MKRFLALSVASLFATSAISHPVLNNRDDVKTDSIICWNGATVVTQSDCPKDDMTACSQAGGSWLSNGTSIGCLFSAGGIICYGGSQATSFDKCPKEDSVMCTQGGGTWDFNGCTFSTGTELCWNGSKAPSQDLCPKDDQTVCSQTGGTWMASGASIGCIFPTGSVNCFDGSIAASMDKCPKNYVSSVAASTELGYSVLTLTTTATPDATYVATASIIPQTGLYYTGSATGLTASLAASLLVLTIA
ncbi:hypothetical protein BC830DRAFT_1170437 [Chytriomyces sp. MP71]|nr:hypothetical protein BC830DRAFT_1170437 [Chytriomyces sp. MP71]